MSEMVHITINKQPLEVPAGTRIIEAAKMLNIDIPHLCYHPDQTIKAHCRMCMVEVVGSRKLTAACSTVVWEGMEVITDSKKVYDAQTGVLRPQRHLRAPGALPPLQPAPPGAARHLLRRAAAHRQPLHRPRPRQVRQVRPLREGVRRGPGLRRPDLLRPLRRLQGHHRL